LALRDWLQLTLTDGIGPILTARLIVAAGSAEAAAKADRRLLQSIEGIGPGKSGKIYDSLRKAGDSVTKEMERCAQAGITLISRDDSTYPALLRSIPDPPSVLYVHGTLQPLDLNAIAIVGSRLCTHYGREQAERFAGLLAGAGMTVISGGARGVDSAAHRGAIAHPRGRTIAVLGCGLDIVYPPENESLFGQIVDRGAVISEFPLGTPPMKENFPRRNRIVSGMSRGVLVVEADLTSGALITARQACDDHGRPVFAIPGRIDNAQSAGPHALIRDGAVLTTNLPDILENLGPLPEDVAQPIVEKSPEDLFVESAPASPSVARPNTTFSDRQRQILEAFGSEASDVDSIIARTGLSPETVLQELTVMSLRGLVRRIDGQTYQRR
jgi:DNA processing protein